MLQVENKMNYLKQKVKSKKTNQILQQDDVIK